jgi:hypothetical protein
VSGETVPRPPGRLVQKLARNLHEGWWVRLDGAWVRVSEVKHAAGFAHVTYERGGDWRTVGLPLGGDYQVVIP